MPRQPCWAMDGPSRRACAAEPERGNLSEAMAERWGKAFLVPFGAVCQKGPAVRAEPVERRGAPNGYVPKPTKRSKDQKIAACGSSHMLSCPNKKIAVCPGSHTKRAFVMPVNPSLLCPSSGLGRLDDVYVTTQSDDQTQVLAACQTSCSGQKTQ